MWKLLPLWLSVAGHGEALLLSRRTCAHRTESLSRRGLLSDAASMAGLVLAGPLPAFADSKKNYMTLAEYQKIQDQEKKDEALYGKFESLRERAGQTREFDSLAEKGEFGKISELARAWDSTIRKEVLESASAALSGEAKADAERTNKAILADLKLLDKLAKAKDVDGVAPASATLSTHVLDFVKLEPQRLVERFGVGDL